MIPRIHKVAVVVGAPIVPKPVEGSRRRSEVAALTQELQTSLQLCLTEALQRAGVESSLAREGSKSG